jgi:hypothetical protein
VKRILPSEFGSNTKLADVASMPYLKAKIKFGHYVEEKGEEGLIEYTMVNTGGLAEYAVKTEFYGINVKERTFHCIGDGKQKCTFTSLPDTGKYVVAVLKHPEITKNADVFISSFESDYLSIIDLLEKETGEKFKIYHETAEEQIKMGLPDYLVLMREMLLDGRGINDREGYVLWNDKFPEVKTMNLEDVVKECLREMSP